MFNIKVKLIWTKTIISVTTEDFIFVTSTSEQPISDSCQLSEFGCCPDEVTAAAGINLEGCNGIDFNNCTFGNENDTGNVNYTNLKQNTIKLCITT